MRSAVPVFALILLLASGAEAFAGQAERPGAPGDQVQDNIVPGLIFIKLTDVRTVAPGASAVGLSGVDAVLQRIMATSVEPLHPVQSLRKAGASQEAQSLARIMLVRYSAPVNPRALVGELERLPGVEYAEPYFRFRLLGEPNDARYAEQWALDMLNMADAWDVTTGDSTVVIGYIDTGINYNHEDLRDNIYINPGEYGTNGDLRNNGRDDDGNGLVDDWRGWDFLGNGTLQNPVPDNDPMDFDGHGTSGAGIAAARTNNGTGIAGVGYNTKILPIKVQNDGGTTDIAGYGGLRYAADMGCTVINASWGSYGEFSQVLQDEIDYAWSKGVLVVGGAGNNAINTDLRPFLPACLNHVLAVSSLEQDGSATTTTSFGTSVHVYAPGTDILTVRMSFGYQTVTGTSFATPHISGLAALIFAQHPDWTPDQVLKQIRVTADRLGAGDDPLYYGKANGYTAVSANATLEDIPGLGVSSVAVSTASGAVITEPEQTATVDVTLMNYLAPTADATVELEVDPLYGSLDATSFTLGGMLTEDTEDISFTFTLAEDANLSEGYVPVILKFTDGSYVDYDIVRIRVEFDEGWRTTFNAITYGFNSIDVPDRFNIWVNGNYSEDNVPTQDLAIRSSDGGQSWVFAWGQGYPDGEGVYCIDAIDEFNAWVGTGPVDGQAEIYYTSDGGQSWGGTSVGDMTPFVNWIHMYSPANGIMQGDPKDNAWGIATTSDGGRSWTPLSTPLTAAEGEAGWNNSYDVVGDNVWFGTNSGIIYRSTDRGQTWTSHTTPSRNSVDVTFRDAMVGAARFSRLNDVGTDTLAITQDGGQTWSLVSTIAAPYGSVIWERQGERLWFLQSPNAYVSTDLGATWSVQPTPYTFWPVFDAAEWNDGFITRVFGASYHVYEYTSNHRSVVSAERPPMALPGTPRITNVYPQPASSFQGSLTAEFTLGDAAPVTLAVYDMNGRKLREAVNATLRGGSHTARVSLNGLSAGSYVLRLTTPAHSTSRTISVTH